MEKNAIKKYAVWARRELIARVSQKAEQYGITEEHHGDAYAERIGEQLLTRTEQNQRKNLITRIEQEGYKQVMEEVAYTWFNRFIALRFMEVNGYLPTRIRVFTDEENAFKPQILAEAIHMEMDGLDMEKVYAFKEKNQTEELFKYLIITQCNALSSILPGMFQTISDYTELLFPDNLLREGSVIQQMIELIPEEDWEDQVQIIGWLYQYYNTEPKDQVFADLKKNIKISKEKIPAATQLFTPDWIVRYMVENSLGRLWVEGHPDEALQSTWKYYLPEAEQEPQVQAQLAEIRKEYANIKPEDIRCIDPCMGSGHILAYMFDVLMQIYEAYGYSTREAAQSIVENNLYGLDIDERAAQLAYFAVMMKARQYDRRFFTRGVQPHVYATYGDEEGENFGSLVMADDPGERPQEPQSIFDLLDYERRLNAWNYRRVLAQKYHVVVTNPPYMSNSSFSGGMTKYIQTHYAEGKYDLCCAFIIRCLKMIAPRGKVGMITQSAWLFQGSYKQLRSFVFDFEIDSLVHLGSRAFDEIAGEVVQTATFILSKKNVDYYHGKYIRLTESSGESGKEKEYFSSSNCYESSILAFSGLPDMQVAYWVSERVLALLAEPNIVSDYGDALSGLSTSDNNRFLRFWFEVKINNIGFNYRGCKETLDGKYKWVPHNKGGSYRRWYGNRDYVVNWENDGAEIKHAVVNNPTDPNTKSWSRRIFNTNFFFKEGITWSDVATGDLSCRYVPEGVIFNATGPTLFLTNPDELYYFLAYFNSSVFQVFLNLVCPGLHYNTGPISRLPVHYDRSECIRQLARNCIEISQTDWDSFETSWDFTRHPLVRPVSTIAQAYAAWEAECKARFHQLKANEEELNRIFIDIYGLQDELTPEVEDKDVTVRKADLGRDIRSLISYAVGCMFGRYSIYKNGLLFAGEPYSLQAFVDKLNDRPGIVSAEELNRAYHHEGIILEEMFYPDKDNILPISDDEYFADDIVGKFVNFIEVVYGEETLEANLKFIADALGGKGSPREVIRSYFLNDFYADHLKIYQKRPIYWLFDSGKKNGFKCLVYMHRYAPDTIARIRTDYVHEQQSRYRTAIHDLENRIASASTGERVKLTKQLTKLRDQAEEARVYEEKIHHYADQMIAIDLDDGVKVNYAKFQDVLAKIK